MLALFWMHVVTSFTTSLSLGVPSHNLSKAQISIFCVPCLKELMGLNDNVIIIKYLVNHEDLSSKPYSPRKKNLTQLSNTTLNSITLMQNLERNMFENYK